MQLSKIMFKESKLTVNDVVHMVLAYTIKFGVTTEGRLQLIELLKVCAGSEFQYMKISDRNLDKVVNC